MPTRVFDFYQRFGLHPKDVIAKAEELGIRGLRVAASVLNDSDAARLEEALTKGSPQQMNPDLKNRKLVAVQAGMTWDTVFKHRVYSCPDLPTHEFVFGATSLLLRSNATDRRVPLNVERVLVCDLRVPHFLETVPEKYRARFDGYKEAVQNIPSILDGDCSHRFYFLSTEPWPDEMQQQTVPALTPLTEWPAILSILTDPGQFFQWPQVGALLWPACVLPQNDGEHIYSEELRTRLERLGIRPDTRTNGPAIVSFLAAGGKRPSWGNEGWPIHHVFGGTNDGNIFSHSAGLVAAHPVAHHLAHQSSLLRWLLRREAFLRFGFDPRGDFVDA